ncbi:hypothetical protein [Streptomyces erythrochromogenes]|uniref:hypothetical protein n=1 Tax=Streptomyces erythrochromogenes TaxID=285574 RepID=UPI00386CD79A|nr:hypothetical protein OG364_39905 [Streptomyces erythrochromogenes]
MGSPVSPARRATASPGDQVLCPCADLRPLGGDVLEHVAAVVVGHGKLGGLALRLLTDWLHHWRRRWPGTGALHLLIDNQTAKTTGRASDHWISVPVRGRDATLERLRVTGHSKKP